VEAIPVVELISVYHREREKNPINHTAARSLGGLVDSMSIARIICT
jgi:hypothetical protein